MLLFIQLIFVPELQETEVCPGCKQRFEEGEESQWAGCDICWRWWHWQCAGLQCMPSISSQWVHK